MKCITTVSIHVVQEVKVMVHETTCNDVLSATQRCNVETTSQPHEIVANFLPPIVSRMTQCKVINKLYIY